MADSFDKAVRSQIMRKVRAKDTAPELALRRAIFSLGFRYRLHVESLPGKPDLVLPRYRSVIFVNGCFWHWHGCRRSRWPSDNATYWKSKIERNCKRDLANHAGLLTSGWRVLIIWECALKNSTITSAAHMAGAWLRNGEPFCVIEPENDVPGSPLLCKSGSISTNN